MNKLGRIVCGIAVALAGCAAPASDDSGNQRATDDIIVPREAAQRLSSARLATGVSSVFDEDEDCTVTDQTACRVGQCEQGPNDTFVRLTELCCTPDGSCTTEHYKLCGC